jgi:hypothetical protein
MKRRYNGCIVNAYSTIPGYRSLASTPSYQRGLNKDLNGLITPIAIIKMPASPAATSASHLKLPTVEKDDILSANWRV